MITFNGCRRQIFRMEKSEESSIPIRTLYVNAVNNYPSDARLVYTTFLHYGAIHNVFLHSSQVFFFITFKNSESALRVLSKRGFFRKKFCYFVRPADQWHQPLELPDGSVVWNRTELDAEAKAESFEPEKPSLMKLNNDCLMHIFENLSLRELLRLELVNKRMRSLSLTRWSRVTHLDFQSVFPWDCEMSLASFRELLLRCGPALTSLDISQLRFPKSDRAFLLIGKHCPNIKRLDVSGHEVKSDSLLGMLKIVGQLESMKMNKCLVLEPCWDWLLKNAKSLTELYANNLDPGFDVVPLEEIFFIKGIKNIPMENIRVLHIDSLRGNLADLLKKHPQLEDLLCEQLSIYPAEVGKNQLKRLTIISQFREPECFLMKIWPQLTELEHFSLTCDINTYSDLWLEFRPNLPNSKKLKELFMHHWPIDGDHLVSIGRMLNGQLKKFSYHGCEMLGDEDIVEFLVTQPNLEYLDVTQGDASFALPILELKSYVRAREEPTPLVVVVDECVEWMDTVDEPLLKFVLYPNDCSQCLRLRLPFGDLALEFDNEGDMIRILNPHAYDFQLDDAFYSDGDSETDEGPDYDDDDDFLF